MEGRGEGSDERRKKRNWMMMKKQEEEREMGKGHFWQTYQFTEEIEPQKEEVSYEMMLVRAMKWISMGWT